MPPSLIACCAASRKAHARAAALAGDAQVGHLIIVRLPAQRLGRHFLEPLHAFKAHRVRRPRHGVHRLAAAGVAGVRKMLRRVAPDNVAGIPGHVEHLGGCAMHVDHRFGSQVADARLNLHAALRSDDDQPVEAGAAAVEDSQRYAHAAHLGANLLGLARHPLVPLELLGALVQRLLQEAACHVRALALLDSGVRTPPCPPGNSRAATPPGPRRAAAPPSPGWAP